MSETSSRSGPPRVLYVITDALSTRLLRGQLRHLVDAGFDVHLAGPHDPQLAAFARSEGAVPHGLPMRREPSPVADALALARTVRLIRSLRPDIVNASTPKAGLLGMLAARLCRVPVRVHVMRGLRSEVSEGLRRRLLVGAERTTVRAATHVVCNSTSLRAVAERSGILPPGAGRVLARGSGNGVDVDRFAALPERDQARAALGLTPEDRVIGFVGRMTADKGIDDLVAAFDRVVASIPRARLLLVGGVEAGDPPAATTLARIDGDDAVVTTGWHDDPRFAYAAMDVLAFPSYREGLPNVPLESQAAGVPVVGYAATGTVDAVQPGQTGMLVPVGDVAALADALATVLGDAEGRTEMGEAGRAWVSTSFARQVVWAELEQLYRTALGLSS